VTYLSSFSKKKHIHFFTHVDFVEKFVKELTQVKEGKFVCVNNMEEYRRHSV